MYLAQGSFKHMLLVLATLQIFHLHRGLGQALDLPGQAAADRDALTPE